MTKRVREYVVALLVLETLMIGTFCALDGILFYLFRRRFDPDVYYYRRVGWNAPCMPRLNSFYSRFWDCFDVIGVDLSVY